MKPLLILRALLLVAAAPGCPHPTLIRGPQLPGSGDQYACGNGYSYSWHANSLANQHTGLHSQLPTHQR